MSSVALKSGRGVPLIWSTDNDPDRVVLTVEHYTKWYDLYLVHRDGRVETIQFPDSEWCKGGESPFVDHVPNPSVVLRFAEKSGYEIDERAFEIMVGRWHIEVVDGV